MIRPTVACRAPQRKRSAVAEWLVPSMAVIFVVGGLVILGLGEVGWNDVVCKKACLTPESVKGMKVRISPSAASKMFWTSLAANGVQMPLSELFPALQSGLVEAADGGTLFLDEIGELPLPLQTRLLRVLEEREVLRVGATEPTPVDLRVVAATLQSLEQRAAAGSFRRDLYYRLAALRIALPTLRARRGDIPLLTTHFFRELRGIDAPLDAEALALLSAADWPGNVRELRNLVDRLRIHWQPGEGLIDAARLLQLAPELVNEGVAALPVESNGKRPPRAQLEALLQEHRNDREGMAQVLGVSRTTLWRWLREGSVG